MRIVTFLAGLAFLAGSAQAAPLVVAFANIPTKPRVKLELPAARPAKAASSAAPALGADDAYNFFQLIAVQPGKPKPAAPAPRVRKASSPAKRRTVRRRKAPSRSLPASRA